MSPSEALLPPIDAEQAGQILVDVLSFADAGTWRDPDPSPEPFAELPKSR